jgi:hypothetical protein
MARRIHIKGLSLYMYYEKFEPDGKRKKSSNQPNELAQRLGFALRARA